MLLSLFLASLPNLERAKRLEREKAICEPSILSPLSKLENPNTHLSHCSGIKCIFRKQEPKPSFLQPFNALPHHTCVASPVHHLQPWFCLWGPQLSTVTQVRWPLPPIWRLVRTLDLEAAWEISCLQGAVILWAWAAHWPLLSSWGFKGSHDRKLIYQHILASCWAHTCLMTYPNYVWCHHSITRISETEAWPTIQSTGKVQRGSLQGIVLVGWCRECLSRVHWGGGSSLANPLPVSSFPKHREASKYGRHKV